MQFARTSNFFNHRVRRVFIDLYIKQRIKYFHLYFDFFAQIIFKFGMTYIGSWLTR